MIHTIYFRKPVTGQLMKYDVDSPTEYTQADYAAYKSFAEAQLGLPLKNVFIRVK